MKNTMKRMLSGIMAMTMVCGVTSISAFAEGAAELEKDSVEISSGEVTLPEIEVEVPSQSDTIVINPFDIGATGQIYSGDFEVINKSEVPLTLTFTAAKVTGENITIAAKAPAATGAKSAMVNFVYTDGLGKATTKVLSETETDIAVSTAMAPYGGSVKYTFTGSTTINPTKTEGSDPWTSSDKITVSNAFKFTANTYATYEIKKTLALYSGTATEMTVAADATDEDILAKLPSSILGDGKELPVTWTNAENVWTAELDTTTYENITDIYTVADGLTWPTITVTKEEAESGT